MERVILGRTKLRVGVVGLGCGGHSRLGQSRGASAEESVALVQRALDLGIDLLDTAAVYGTEEIVGRAVSGRRQQVVISSKAWPEGPEGPIAGEHLRARLEASLRRLGTDHIDVFHLHGVTESLYDHCRAELVPELLRARDAGKIRFLALSERFVEDPGHRMLARAVGDDVWDAMMVGFNLLNPSSPASTWCSRARAARPIWRPTSARCAAVRCRPRIGSGSPPPSARWTPSPPTDPPEEPP